MGFLLEYMPDVRPAQPATFATCATLLRQLHDLSILHTDTNIYNFLISKNGAGLMCDFEGCKLEAGPVELGLEEQGLVALNNDIGQADEDGSDIGQDRLKRQRVGQYRI
jgi:serine/threonine protein kinase